MKYLPESIFYKVRITGTSQAFLRSTNGLVIVTDEHVTGWNAFEPTLSRIEQMEYADISGSVLHQSHLIGLSMMAKGCSTLLKPFIAGAP